MRKIIFILLIGAVSNISGQISTNSVPQDTSTDQNVFMDAASNFNYSANSSHSIGKGLGFPQTDLSQFEFITTNLDGINYPSYFDGMVVYNIGTGSTNDPSLTTQTEGLTPGFYYFYNPNGEANQSVSEGKWVRIGGAAEAKRTTASGKEIFTQKGEFTLKTGDNGTSILFPEGMTSLYSIKIYRKDGDASHLVGSSLYTYKLNAGEGQKNIIFGTGIISTAYPAGTYEYEMEYIQ